MLPYKKPAYLKMLARIRIRTDLDGNIKWIIGRARSQLLPIDILYYTILIINKRIIYDYINKKKTEYTEYLYICITS